jgi:hypothetical protein
MGLGKRDRRERHEIVRVQISHNPTHQRTLRPGALAVFQIVELPSDIAGRATGDTRDGAKALEYSTMT